MCLFKSSTSASFSFDFCLLWWHLPLQIKLSQHLQPFLKKVAIFDGNSRLFFKKLREIYLHEKYKISKIQITATRTPITITAICPPPFPVTFRFRSISPFTSTLESAILYCKKEKLGGKKLVSVLSKLPR